MKPVYIVQITDTHIMDEGEAWYGKPETDTQGRLQAVIERINKSDLKPDMVIHTGDITDKGSIDSYLNAKRLLDQLSVPYFVTCGNHDNFDNLAAVFKDQPFKDQKFAQYVVERPTVRILVLDSHVPEKDYGFLCEERKIWITERLKEELQKPTLVFLHHFPMDVQEPLFSTIKLQNADDLRQIVLENPQIKGIYCGHYHHASASIFQGVMCWVSPSTAPSHIVDEKNCRGLNLTQPSYSLHEFKGDSPISKIISVCPILLR